MFKKNYIDCKIVEIQNGNLLVPMATTRCGIEIRTSACKIEGREIESIIL